MRFLVDENLPSEVADQLRNAGHDAATVGARQLTGAVDSTLAALCQAEERGLLTLDLDFANTLRFPPADYFGRVAD